METPRLSLLAAGAFFILAGIASFLVDVPGFMRLIALVLGATCTVIAVWAWPR